MSPSIAPIAINQAANTPPSKLAIIAKIISKIAAPMLYTNLEDTAHNIPIISHAIPYKNDVRAKIGEKIRKNIPNIPARPKIIRIILPISASIKPILAKVLDIYSPPVNSF